MIKVVTLLKRRPGLSREAFIAYYEGHHRLIGEKVLAGYATKYVRRYLAPGDGAEEEQDFDVVMEIWFPDAATRQAWQERMKDPATRAGIAADEEKLFDRRRIRSFTVTEAESDLPPPG